MEPRWTVERADAWDEQVEFGPGRDSLPKSFGACIAFTQSGARVELSGQFNGQRIVVTHLGLDCEVVTPRLLSGLMLAAVVHDVGQRLLKLGELGAISERPRPWRGALHDEMRFVATLYWREHVTGGTPLKAVARTWDLPEQTAHRWCRQARQLYGLPD